MQQAQAVNDVIDRLSAKLAVPTAHLWAILQRQAILELIPDVLVAISLGVVWFFWRRFYLAPSTDKYDDKFGYVLFAGGLAAVSLLCIVVIGTDLSRALNPEYYALHAILEALKPKG